MQTKEFPRGNALRNLTTSSCKTNKFDSVLDNKF